MTEVSSGQVYGEPGDDSIAQQFARGAGCVAFPWATPNPHDPRVKSNLSCEHTVQI